MNALTGESTEFPLPVAISDGGAYFDIGYSDAGWGWLKPIGGKDDDKVMLSSLFVLKACKTTVDGRVFVQNLKEKTATWIDDDSLANQKRAHNMQVYGHKLVASVFFFQRTTHTATQGWPSQYGWTGLLGCQEHQTLPEVCGRGSCLPPTVCREELQVNQTKI